MKIDISADTRAVTARLEGIARKQIPFATAKALNRLANEGQAAEKDRVRSQFNIKSGTFIPNTIKRRRGVDFATKQKPEAAVVIDPERQHLGKWERGGFKTSVRGKRYVAVPSKDIRRTKKGLVPRSLYPSQFKPFAKATNLKSKGGKQVQDVGQKNTFFVRTKSGNPLLVQRVSKKRIRGLYLFVRQTKLDKRLEFVPTITRIVKTRAKAVMAEEVRHALATAR